MLIRLLAIAGLLSVAYPTYAQSYFDSYGYSSSPLHNSGHCDWYGGQADPSYYSYHQPDSYGHAPGIYGYGERIPPSCGGFDYQGLANRHTDLRGHLAGCGQPHECPLERGTLYDQPGFDRNAFRGFHQRGSNPSGHDHAHDGQYQGHTHAQPPTLPGDTGRFRVVPNTGQFEPPTRAPFPRDRDRLAPPSLPRASEPGQMEVPLGDGPPPATVPLSSPAQLRVPASASWNV